MIRVLVVEDDPVNALLFRMILEKRGGWEVEVLEDPAAILARCREGGADLVIMDVSLSNSRWEGKPVNGVDVCRLLKTDPATSDLPVVLATAHAMRGDAEALLAESLADDYVSKPIMDHGQFVEQVRSNLRKAA